MHTKDKYVVVLSRTAFEAELTSPINKIMTIPMLMLSAGTAKLIYLPFLDVFIVLDEDEFLYTVFLPLFKCYISSSSIFI